MRLAEAIASAAGPERMAHGVLDRRLRHDDPHPVAVGFSGGGDSLALLLMAKTWAMRARRPLLALTVDHRLQPQGGAWTKACQRIAEREDIPFQALEWTGPKPSAGVPAAARAARHRLLADAARAAGCRVILLGHTADDRLEAQAMRAAGASTPDPREWSPSPSWPQGRGLFLLRPMLGLRRAALRCWLAARGETWIDDPANEDPRYARARARLDRPDGPLDVAAAPALDLAHLAVAEPGGVLAAPRAAFAGASPAARRRYLGLACVCAGGGARLPANARLDRALTRMEAGPCVGGLAGARIEADGETLRIMREAGEAERSGLQPLHLRAGETGVWDGRFEVTTARDLVVRALGGVASRLPADQRRRLRGLPPAVRPTLPVACTPEGFTCPLVGTDSTIILRDLTHGRFLAAAGLIVVEPA